MSMLITAIEGSDRKHPPVPVWSEDSKGTAGEEKKHSSAKTSAGKGKTSKTTRSLKETNSTPALKPAAGPDEKSDGKAGKASKARPAAKTTTTIARQSPTELHQDNRTEQPKPSRASRTNRTHASEKQKHAFSSITNDHKYKKGNE